MKCFSFDPGCISRKIFQIDSKSRITYEHPGFINAAISFLLQPNNAGSYDLILIMRTNSKKIKHPGEMAFPGGKPEEEDKDLISTALRECEEEIAIPRNDINVLGVLNDFPTPAGFIITPVVCWIERATVMKPSLVEVKEIIPIPVNFFANPIHYREFTFVRNDEVIAVGSYRFVKSSKTYVIYGATAHVIVHFLKQVYHINLMAPGTRRATPQDFHTKWFRQGKR
jgi:8-oxo-dGTP pyrophosphatase MutT (NUDIX family)